jgi:hypothetical protein
MDRTHSDSLERTPGPGLRLLQGNASLDELVDEAVAELSEDEGTPRSLNQSQDNEDAEAERWTHYRFPRSVLLVGLFSVLIPASVTVVQAGALTISKATSSATVVLAILVLSVAVMVAIILSSAYRVVRLGNYFVARIMQASLKDEGSVNIELKPDGSVKIRAQSHREPRAGASRSTVSPEQEVS